MAKVLAIACVLAAGWPTGILYAQAPTQRAWTILEQGAASTDHETRIAAVETVRCIAAAIVRLGGGTRK